MTISTNPASRKRGGDVDRGVARSLDLRRASASTGARLFALAMVTGLMMLGAVQFTYDQGRLVAESPCDASVGSPRAPGPPRNVKAQFMNGSFRLTWSAPSDTGNPTLSGYRVHWDPSEPPLDELPTTTGRNVPQWKGIGLTHTIKVAAVNCAGSSFLTSVDALGAELPSVPRTFGVEIAGTFAIISWKAPASTGSARAISGYVLTYETGSDSTTVQLAHNVFEHILSGLTAGARYTFQLAAKSTYGTGATASESATIPLPSDAPRSFSATYSGGQIVLTWQAPASSTAISGYKLTQTVGSVTTTATLAANALRHTVSSPSAGDTYEFRLAAVSNGSEGTAVTASVAIPSVPGAPTSLNAMMSGANVVVSWSAPSTASGLSVTGYTVSWSAGQLTGSGSTTASVRSYTISSPTRGITLNISVSAKSALGTGTPATVSFTVPSPPSAPRSLSLAMSGANLAVSWDAPAQSGTTAVSSYNLKWSYDSTVGSARLGGTTRSYTITSPVAGKRYTVSLSATNSAGKGPLATASFTIPSAPDAPRNLAARMSGNDLEVSWSAPSYAGTSAITGYSLKWKFGTPQQSGSTTKDGNEFSHTIASATAGATYELVVSATNAVGSGPTATLSYTIPSPPSKPRDLDAELQANGDFRVSWKSPNYAGTSAISKYRLTWTVSGSSATSSIETTGLLYDITSPSLGKTYALNLVAINAVGNSPATTLNAVVPSPPGKVANLAVQMSGEGLSVSWDAPSYSGTTQLSGYVVSWVTGSTNSSKTLMADTTTYTIPEVVQGKTYTVAVSAKNSVGAGPGVSLQFTVPQPPGTPRNFTAMMSGGALVLAWQAPSVTGTSAITGYALSWTVDGTTTDRTLGAAARGHTIASPASGKTFQFSLRAVNSAGRGHNADTSLTVPRPPGAPTSLAASVDANGKLTVQWSAPAQAVTPAIKHYALSWTVTGDTTGGSTQVGVNVRKHIITSPTKGATYSFTVAGVSDAGTGPTSSISYTVPKPPSEPSGLSATIVANGGLRVSWSAPTYLGTPKLSGYRISWTVGESSGSAVKPRGQRSHVIQSPSAGATYSFNLTAFNSAGSSSAVSLDYTAPAVPGTPRDFSAELVSGNVNLKWKSPTYVGVPALSGYQLSWSIRAPRTAAVTSGSASLSSSKLAHSLSSIAAGSELDISLVARNSTGDSPSVAATVTIPSSPDAPRNLDAELGTDGDLDITWAAPTYTGTAPITGYSLEWTVGGDTTSVTTNASTTSYSVTSPTPGARYDIAVKATNSVGTGGAATNHITVPAPPGAPRNLAWSLVTADGDVGLRITWEAPEATGTSSINGYRIQYTVGQTSTTKSLGTEARSYTIDDPLPGEQYTIKLSARTNDGTAAASLTFTVPKPPSAPREFTASLDQSGKIALGWSAPLTAGTSPISGYELSVNVGTSGARGASSTAVILPVSTRSHEIADPVPGGTYRFGLVATSTAGKGNGVELTFTIPEIPGTPGATVGNVNDDGDIAVSWSAPSNRVASALTSYELTWRRGSETGTANIKDGTSPSFVLDDPVPGGVYAFSVRSVGPVGKSAAVTLTVTVPAPPGAPRSFTASISAGELKLSWTAPADDGTATLSGYELSWTVEGSPSTPPNGSATLGALATSYTISTPKYGSVYAFKLHAVTSDGAGPVTALRYRAPTVPKMPLNLSARYSDGTTTISWRPPASDGGTSVTGYEVSWEPITGSGRASLNADQLSLSVSSLKLGIVYRFALIARNAVGMGQIATLDYEVSASAPSGKTFDDNPRRLPLDFKATFLNGVSSFTWQLPSVEADDSIVQFVLSWSATEHDHFGTVTLLPNTVEYDLSGLRRGAEYAISLVVVRKTGASTPIARFFTVPSLQTIDQTTGVGAVPNVSTVLDLRVSRQPRQTVRVARSQWLGPADLQLYQTRDSVRAFWDDPENREVLGWTVDWVPESPDFPAVLPASVHHFAIAAIAPVESCTVKVRAVYADGLSDRTRAVISLATEDSARDLPRSETLNITHQFGKQAAIQRGELSARVVAPSGTLVLGDAVELKMGIALMPRISLDGFTVLHEEMSLKLKARLLPNRKHADTEASRYRMLSPLEVCLANPDHTGQSNETVNSVVVSRRTGIPDVLDSEQVRRGERTETCASVHELDLDEPTYFGLVSRNVTDDDGLTWEDTSQGVAIGLLLVLNLIFSWSRARR